MGMCCIKGTNILNDSEDKHSKRHNQNYLFAKNLSKNHDSIFTTQTKEQAKIDANKQSTNLQDNLFEDRMNDFLTQVDKQNKFFTYFPYSVQVEALVNEYIRLKRTGKNDQKYYQKTIKETHQMDIHQNQRQLNKKLFDLSLNEDFITKKTGELTSQKYLTSLIEAGKTYLDQIKQFIESKFVEQLSKTSLIKRDPTISKSILVQLVSQLYQIYRKNQTEQKFKLTTKLQEDILRLLIAQIDSKGQIPNQILTISSLISNLKSESETTNPEDVINSQKLQDSQQCYLVKMQLTDLCSKLKNASIKNKIDKISIVLAQSNTITKNDQQKQLISISTKELNSKLNDHQNPSFSEVSIEFVISPHTIIKFITHPFHSVFTLHPSEFVKFLYVNQTFSFVKKNHVLPTKNLQNKNNLETQFTDRPQFVANIKVKMQIFSSNWNESLQKLKLHAKNMVHELQNLKKGQNTWDHLNSLKSSFASISQNQSSFISHYESGGFCC